MKNKAILSIALAMAAMADSTNAKKARPVIREKRELSQKEKIEIDARINKNKGLKEFNFGENSLWALNEKTAIRKAKKRGWC